MTHQELRAPEDITFEAGYEELKTIVGRLDADDVSVHEMFEGFRRGKGLERSLRAYLTEREGELREIEEGRNLPEFNIVAASGPVEAPAHRGAPPAPEPAAPSAQTPLAADDDIPF
jgi:exodeoxyribonuclease VII small subunit